INSKHPLDFIILKVSGGKKTTTAMTHFKRGNSLIKVNKWSLEMIKLHTLQCKLLDPVLFLGKNWFAGRDTHTCVMCDGWPNRLHSCCESKQGPQRKLRKKILKKWRKYSGDRKKKR
uniref:Uncharacterized protein n=1 Tax=Sciurus vulgaris TaxID=55149 RepID=A0A8D2JJM7_SCIVU